MNGARETSQVVVLEWTFSPADYFEQTIEVQRDEYVLRIQHGKAEAKVDPSAYDADPNYRLAIHELLKGRFLAIQVLAHQAYELSKPSMYRLHADGRKDVTVFLEGAHATATGGSVDFFIKDKDGKILTDTRKERVERKKHFANVVEKYRGTDKTLDAVVNSYAAAVTDPNNELVHLYEIREAVAEKFGGEAFARAALGVGKLSWSRLRQLANNEPLKQGRHRGKKVGNLRDASGAELDEARSIARLLVDSYLAWLENKSG
jgi:hypothetical protein